MKPKQEEALRDYLRESIVPLIEDVLIKKLGQAITFAKEELAAPAQEPVAWVEYETGNHTCTPPAQPAPVQLTNCRHCGGPDNVLCGGQCKAAAPNVQEPVAWKWHQAPIKTSWGHDMVVADLAIDKDNTVSIYCERDQTAKVEAMFAPPAVQPAPEQYTAMEQALTRLQKRYGELELKVAAQRTWVGLTHGEYIEAEKAIWDVVSMDDTEKKANREFYRSIEAKLKEKNTP
jgi:hypothetical protein